MKNKKKTDKRQMMVRILCIVLAVLLGGSGVASILYAIFA